MAGGSLKRSSRRAPPDASGAADAREPLLDWRGAQLSLARDERLELRQGAWLLRGFAAPDSDRLRADLSAVAAAAPFRHMQTPGGFTMSVAMTNCGALGWVSDATGYRYSELDPASGLRWPPMPAHRAESPVRDTVAFRPAPARQSPV